jgi:hypothetical protein
MPATEARRETRTAVREGKRGAAAAAAAEAATEAAEASAVSSPPVASSAAAAVGGGEGAGPQTPYAPWKSLQVRPALHRGTTSGPGRRAPSKPGDIESGDAQREPGPPSTPWPSATSSAIGVFSAAPLFALFAVALLLLLLLLLEAFPETEAAAVGVTGAQGAMSTSPRV